MSATILLWVPVPRMTQRPLIIAYLRIKLLIKQTQNKTKLKCDMYYKEQVCLADAKGI